MTRSIRHHTDNRKDKRPLWMEALPQKNYARYGERRFPFQQVV